MLDTDVILIIFDVNKIQNSSKFLLLGKFFEIKTVSQKLSSLLNEKIQKNVRQPILLSLQFDKKSSKWVEISKIE